jgi:hypothetical protein
MVWPEKPSEVVGVDFVIVLAQAELLQRYHAGASEATVTAKHARASADADSAGLAAALYGCGMGEIQAGGACLGFGAP